MEVKSSLGKQVFIRYFCDACGKEEKPYATINAPRVEIGKEIIEERCDLCKLCYNLLRLQIVSKGGRTNEVVPEPSPCSIGWHSWTHPDDQGNMWCLICNAYQFDAEQARRHAND